MAEDESISLVSIFTNDDYHKSVKRIPCYYAQKNEDNDEIEIEIFHSISASTDFDLTGQILWPVSILLSHYIASEKVQQMIKGKNVVELGAGCGLPGLVAGKFANMVAITDGNDIVLDLLEKNVDLQNQHDKIFASKLVWGSYEHLTKTLDKIITVDVVIAADVVQWPAVIEPLLHTVKSLLWTSSHRSTQQTKPPFNPIFLIGMVQRSEVSKIFFQLAQELGFLMRKVQNEDFLPNGIVPSSCQEYGGRITEIFELELIVFEDDDYSTQGLLTSQSNTMVGNDYEHTLSLPC